MRPHHPLADTYEQIGSAMERLAHSGKVDTPLLISSNNVENRKPAAIDFSMLLRERMP